ncbi:MAG TPA: PKD domain-containing protein [Polyangia bacterium]
MHLGGLLAAASGVVGCGDDRPGAASAVDSGAPADAAAGLRADPGLARYALVGGDVVLDGSASSGARRYQWYFGDGRGWAGPRPTAVDHVSYDQPGRYEAVLTVFDDAGHRSAAAVIISVTYPIIDVGVPSATLAAIPDGSGQVAVVAADADQLVVIGRDASDQFSVVRRIATCRHPRTVAAWQGFLVTACQDADRIGFYPLDGGAAVELPLAYGAAPFGVGAFGASAFVTLQGRGSVVEVRLDAGGAPVLFATTVAVADPRAVAPLGDGRVAVARWRSPDYHAEIAFLDPVAGKRELVTLALDRLEASADGVGGIPSYLDQFVVSPTGRQAVVPSLVANFSQGSFLDGHALTFDTTLRAALSVVDLTKDEEDLQMRAEFAHAGRAGAAAFSAHGDYAFVALPGDRAVARFDLLAGAAAGLFVDAGFAPDGTLVVADDRFLLVNAPLSRELVVYDLSAPIGDSTPPVARVPLLIDEPLDATILRGAQLFNDAADPRLAGGGYLACADCHLDGDSDQRVWDFSDRGEGLRNTISLRGRAGSGDGPLNWDATFDEAQDEEQLIRHDFGGSGLMSDADFAAGTRAQGLGDAKAGLSADLDALAAYVTSLRSEPRSPFRNSDGTLTDAATRGKALLESPAQGCLSCHAGPRLTDSQLTAPGLPLLHDVGTLSADSGQRVGAPLTGLDTPTLRGLWQSAPYLHDGSAATLQAVLRDRNPSDRHGVTSALTAAELSDLIAYLQSLDGRTD